MSPHYIVKHGGIFSYHKDSKVCQVIAFAFNLNSCGVACIHLGCVASISCPIAIIA